LLTSYEFPSGGIERILVVKTAPTVVVQRVIQSLVVRYPGARFGVLGTNLLAIPAFRAMERFEIGSAWLTPRSFRSLRRRVAASAFDMVVMCLNNDCGSGYAKASRVVRSIPSRHRAVVTLSGKWRPWDHEDFESGAFLFRAAVNTLGWIIYPVTLLGLLLMSSKPRYMPDGQGRPAPEYES
jgi:hypothetical protein